MQSLFRLPPYDGLRFKIFVQPRSARFYDANEGRLDSTIAQLHNHVNLSLAAKECFQSTMAAAALRFDKNFFKTWFDSII